MKVIPLVLILAFVAQYLFATYTSINNQLEWDNYISSVVYIIPNTDTVNISSTINITGTITNSGIIIGNGTIGNSGTINNTGIIAINHVFNIGIINSCSPIENAYREAINMDLIPINTKCNDMNPNTVNDAMTEANNCSSCAGIFIAPATSIPTLSEWGLILLSMSLSIIGMVSIRQRILDGEVIENLRMKNH